MGVEEKITGIQPAQVHIVREVLHEAPNEVGYESHFDDLRTILTRSNGEPVFTNESHGLQFQNLWTLVGYALRGEHSFLDGPVLDAGCGDGLLTALLPFFFQQEGIGDRDYYGLDKMKAKVKAAKYVANRVRSSLDTKVRILDPADLVTATLESLRFNGRSIAHEVPGFAIGLSNSALHWITDDEQRQAAIDGQYDMILPGGTYLLSMSTIGTASTFLDARNYVLRDIPIKRRGRKEGRSFGDIVHDPIGSIPAEKLFTQLDLAGFEDIDIITASQPLVYPNGGAYAGSVRAYGYNELLSCLRADSERRLHGFKRRVWDKIVERFQHLLIERGECVDAHSPLKYMQMNAFVRMRKPEYENPIPVGTAPAAYEINTLGAHSVAPVLNENAISRYVADQLGSDVIVALDGKKDALKGVKSRADIEALIEGALVYASNREKNIHHQPDRPDLRITYRVGKDTLWLSFTVYPVHKNARLLKGKLWGKLQHQGLKYGDSIVGADNSVTHTYEAPLSR